MYYELTLPFPPTVNNYYLKTRYGIRVSKSGKTFRKAVADAIHQQFPDVCVDTDPHYDVFDDTPENSSAISTKPLDFTHDHDNNSHSSYSYYCFSKLHVEIIFYPPDKRLRDLDNYLKALLDAITLTGFWTDDSIIDQLVIYRGANVSKSLSSTYLRISPAGPVLPLGFVLP